MIYRKTLRDSENYTKFLKKSTLPWNLATYKAIWYPTYLIYIYIMVFDIGNYPFTSYPYLSYIIILTYIIKKSILFSNKFHLFIIYLFQLYQFSFRLFPHISDQHHKSYYINIYKICNKTIPIFYKNISDFLLTLYLFSI